MAQRQPFYSPTRPPTLAMTELVKMTLDHHHAADLISKWLEHRNDTYTDWFFSRRDQKHDRNQRQMLLWNKGDFLLENIFCRTVDTGRLIPLRTWTTHVYCHRSIHDRKRPMMPVVFTMLPELMLLRAMHDRGCEEIFIIVTDLQRQEMDEVTEYFKLVCRHAFGQCKPSMERRIQLEHMRITHALHRHRRTPCFPQIDLTLRAILYEKRPRFVVLFSPQPTSYSQILFTHHTYVPDEEVFFDYPTGCPNPCCTDNCEMLRFPRRGLETANVLEIKRGGKFGKRVKQKTMCNWIECDVCFSEEPSSKRSSGSSEGTESSENGLDPPGQRVVPGQLCSQCRLVRYCSLDHQRRDWPEHKKVCVRMQWD
ncbi:hypothetical protein EV368DRAFT_37645 [Lentinula lateritia]|uniref:Uncharacterized protein n=1 Tax=Lentinula aff. lateritia TaxID=2804960 RepID=A0ACC1U6D6_9AGAR|nr:hypothetical protein F5876DRAFT_36845 [Lentinula aff. lateritia]KAJ3854036.1 hypothetical protein EV368DRAFT_37645 [Lentinula lateritia]